MDKLSDRRADQAVSRRPAVMLWILGGVLAVALVVGAVAGALRDPETLARNTPQGVVQAYLQALFDDDRAAAREWLSEDTAARCTASDYREAWVEESMTATLEDVDARGEAVEVRVRLRTVSGPGPFGAGGFTSTETFTLVEEGGQWRIADDPWPVFACGGMR
jgi:hypothetical protein